MTTTQTIRERLAAPFAAADVRVNREQGYVDNVLICGVESRNGRTYPAEVLRRDHARYEGVPVNADHKDAPGVADRVGWFSNVRPGADGRPRGRLNVLKSHPLADRIFEAAERRPQLFGMSHVATCSTSRRNGKEVVESINRVLSVDLVADPATTSSLYESTMRRVREGVMLPSGSAVLAAMVDKVKGLVDRLEQGVFTIDQFEQFVAELIADTRKAAAVGEDIPTTGEGFARWLKGERGGPDGKVFAEWLRANTAKPFREFEADRLRPAAAGRVPTDGKAFAALVKGY